MASGNRWRIMSRLTVVMASRKTGANLDRESVVSTLFSSQSKGKRDRDQNVAHSLRENLHKIFERKVDLAVQGERMAQQGLYEAEAVVEARKRKERNSDIAFQKINQDFES